MRVRGLKPHIGFGTLPVNQVAPRAGAWIETHRSRRKGKSERVAPRAGAWIETHLAFIPHLARWSHPVRVRGLKR